MDGIYTSALYEITSHKTCLESRLSRRRLSPGNAEEQKESYDGQHEHVLSS